MLNLQNKLTITIVLVFLFGFSFSTANIQSDKSLQDTNILGLETRTVAQLKHSAEPTTADSDSQPLDSKKHTASPDPTETITDPTPVSALPEPTSTPVPIITIAPTEAFIVPSHTPFPTAVLTSTNTPAPPTPTVALSNTPVPYPTDTVTPTIQPKIIIYEETVIVPIDVYQQPTVTMPTATPVPVVNTTLPVSTSDSSDYRILPTSTPAIQQNTQIQTVENNVVTRDVIDLTNQQQTQIIRPAAPPTTLSDNLYLQTTDNRFAVVVEVDDTLTISNTNNNILLHLSDQAGNNINVSADSFDSIAERLALDDIRIFPGTDSSMILQSGPIAAQTQLDLSINSFNKISVLVDNQNFPLTYLPDRIVQLLHDLNTITNVETNLTSEQEIKMLFDLKFDTTDNSIYYELSGTKLHFFLAFWPINIPTTVRVNAVGQRIFGSEDIDVIRNRMDQLLSTLSL